MKSEIEQRKLGSVRFLQRDIEVMRANHFSSDQTLSSLKERTSYRFFKANELALFVSPIMHNYQCRPQKNWQLLKKQIAGLIDRDMSAVDDMLEDFMKDQHLSDEQILFLIKNQPTAKGFDDHELLLLIWRRRHNIPISKANWPAYQAALYARIFDDQFISFQPNFQPLLGWSLEKMLQIKSDLEAGRLSKDLDFALSAALQFTFASNLKKTLPPQLELFLRSLELSPQFDQAITDAVRRHFSADMQKTARESGAILLKSCREISPNKNHPVDLGSRTYSMFNDLRREISTVVFHPTHGFASPRICVRNDKELARECVRFQRAPFWKRWLHPFTPESTVLDESYHRLLQRLLYQHAYTHIVDDRGWGGALKAFLNTDMFTIGRSNRQSLKIDVHALNEGSTRIDYVYEERYACPTQAIRRKRVILRFVFPIRSNAILPRMIGKSKAQIANRLNIPDDNPCTKSCFWCT